MEVLDERTRSILELERRWAVAGGRKARLIRERLAMSPTRYHHLLVLALDRPEALAFDPPLVGRLRRLRDARRAARRTGATAHVRHGPRRHG